MRALRALRALLLDETTSVLDWESAALLRETMRRLMREREDMTVVMITHDRAMMGMADRVVIEEGRAVEEGSFGELVRRRGRLANLLEEGRWMGSLD